MYPIRTINWDLPGVMEIESGMARRIVVDLPEPSGDPGDEREHNSENDEHDDGADGVEALVP
jgi:hypothetical protein